MHTRTRLLALGFIAVLAAPAGRASAQTRDLTELSLTDLLNLEVTSVSHKQQKLSRTAAAVHVITDEDIRRSAARTIPDLLRMVPGVGIAQISATDWAVTARGFTGPYSDKLLVLVDGRSIYTPMFGGVHWDLQQLQLSDIERIEVIRGPGGTIWGANAVNGVINIITKPAEATHGGHVSTVVGGDERGSADIHYGGSLGERTHYRVSGRHARRGTAGEVEAIDNPDAGQTTRGALRVDWSDGGANRVMAQGAVQSVAAHLLRPHAVFGAPWQTIRRDGTDSLAGNAVVSWTHAKSTRSETALQVYFDAYSRNAEDFRDRWTIADVELRQRQKIGTRHEVVAGAGYRYRANAVRNSELIAFLPASVQTDLISAFAQDEVELAADRFYVTAGVKFEHNTYTGLEVQPTARFAWTPAAGHSIWGAASRAVRTPTRSDRGLVVPGGLSPGFGGLPMLISIEGSPDAGSETLRSIEAGYRLQRRRASIDLTAFVNEYDDLMGGLAGTMARGQFGGRPVLRLPIVLTNGLRASTRGFEMAAAWNMTDWWKVSAAYTALSLDTWSSSELPFDADYAEGLDPEQQFHVRTFVDLPRGFEASVLAYRVTELPALDVPAYTRLDLRLGWTRRHLELATGVQNLLHDGDKEFGTFEGTVAVPVSARPFAEVRWRF